MPEEYQESRLYDHNTGEKERVYLWTLDKYQVSQYVWDEKVHPIQRRKEKIHGLFQQGPQISATCKNLILDFVVDYSKFEHLLPQIYDTILYSISVETNSIPILISSSSRAHIPLIPSKIVILNFPI